MKINDAILPLIPFFESLQLPIAVIDTSGHYIYYNQESAELDNIPAAFALGRNIIDLYPQITKKNSTMLLSALRGLTFKNQKTNYVNYSGDEIDYTHSTAPILNQNGDLIGAIEIGLTFNILKKDTLDSDNFYSDLISQQHSDGIEMIYKSKVMTDTVDIALKIARTDVAAMLYGETGTGKELFARLIHDFSMRKNMPFIAINCASIPETLIESLMFGAKKGAFTGANDTSGFIEKAEGGTLFLDELNSMPASLQPKLLRYLQDGTYWKVGGAKEIHSNVRIIVAVNQKPSELVQQGQIRQDLYYRLCVGYLSIPPLRDRREDISLLADHFLEKYRKRLPHSIDGYTDKAMAYLCQQHWPGNVRMLENTIVRSIIKQSSPGLLQLENIAMLSNAEPLIQTPTQIMRGIQLASEDIFSTDNLEESVTCYEMNLIKKSYEKNRYCLSKTARSLGVKRSTLQYKIKKYALD